MDLLILIIVNFIYNITGISYVILFILAIINLCFATLNLVVNPCNILLRIIQGICIITIIYIIYLNIYLLILKICI